MAAPSRLTNLAHHPFGRVPLSDLLEHTGELRRNALPGELPAHHLPGLAAPAAALRRILHRLADRPPKRGPVLALAPPPAATPPSALGPTAPPTPTHSP